MSPVFADNGENTAFHHKKKQLVASMQEQITVSGQVRDAGGTAIAGVSVRAKGTARTTSTDGDGRYEIRLDKGQTLVFSNVGHADREMVADRPGVFDIVLERTQEKLDEVVVVGYGTLRKSDLTGAVGTVRADALQERPASSLNQGLAGRVTGVAVSSNSGRPGGRTNVRIRGASSVSVSNDPLYVIDGVILNTAGLQNGSTPIDYLNANDVASVEVLKDASSTAIYGARGANGVILITTKRGSSDGGAVAYDSDFSLGTAPKLLPVLNAREFLQVEEIA